MSTNERSIDEVDAETQHINDLADLIRDNRDALERGLCDEAEKRAMRLRLAKVLNDFDVPVAVQDIVMATSDGWVDPNALLKACTYPWYCERVSSLYPKNSLDRLVGVQRELADARRQLQEERQLRQRITIESDEAASDLDYDTIVLTFKKDGMVVRTEGRKVGVNA